MSSASRTGTDLVVRGAREHNLRSVDVRIPRGSLTVVTGPSGSGKSSLAFDTIYAEGQRRYVESLSTRARRTLEQLPAPDVDAIEGLSPAIAVRQVAGARHPRATVGTTTEIDHHLRLLFARVGEPHCPRCGRRLEALTVPEMVDRILGLGPGTRLAVQAPLGVLAGDGLRDTLRDLGRDGFVRVTLDGELRELADLDGGDGHRGEVTGPHDVEVQIDRLALRDGVRPRLAESLELALARAGGQVRVVVRGGDALLLSDTYRCPEHGPVLQHPLPPRTFSFNSPAGACPRCGGLGEESAFDRARIVADPSRSIAEGAIAPWGTPRGVYHRAQVKRLQAHLEVDLASPWSALAEPLRETVLEGGNGWEGVLAGLERRAREIAERRAAKNEGEGEGEGVAEVLAEELARYADRRPCAACGGARLRPEALAVTVGGRSIRDVAAMSLGDARGFLAGLALEGARGEIAERLLSEIDKRLGFLAEVGLAYLSLERPTATLSGGEAQRIRLATRIGSALVGVLYVLDEPSVGLHPRDNERLLGTLRALRDIGSTVLVVEHDADTIRAADHVIDMGPGAGRLGGRIIAEGPPDAILGHPESATGAYLSGRRGLATPARRRARGTLTIEGATTHNLEDVRVDLPLGVMTCVTGVSGSGKSSLVVDTLLPLLEAHLQGRPATVPGRLASAPDLDKVVAVDQGPIGRTPRSNPATYLGVLARLRELFASLPEARARGYKAGRFSFNAKGGRCEACTGDGVRRVRMDFLPDVFVTCEVCGGARYNRETLEVRYRGLSIADVLGLSVDDALEMMEVLPKIAAGLRAMHAVGLGYLTLGQSATTLSGGEAQRLKLARELARPDTGRTLYVLDEPTTGLHFVDVEVLLASLETLIDRGNTVVLVEHDVDVIRQADHVIDLGPDGGDGGGRVVAVGPPEAIAAEPASITGRYLARRLEQPRARAERPSARSDGEGPTLREARPSGRPRSGRPTGRARRRRKPL
ncbi:MAG: excinuclease ABC subunit UvrA [Sandaracinaceae bacterium]